MQRIEVIEVIKRERAYQSENWPRTDPEVVHMYSFAAPHLLLLKQYVVKVKSAWESGKAENPVVKQLAKLATIAVRAMEEHKTTKGSDPYVVINRKLANPDWSVVGAGEAQFSAPHIILLDKMVNLAYTEWDSGYESNAIRRVSTIAAIAILALEQIERGAIDLLTEGLR